MNFCTCPHKTNASSFSFNSSAPFDPNTRETFILQATFVFTVRMCSKYNTELIIKSSTL